MKKLNDKEVLICQCNSDEHQYLIYYGDEQFENGNKNPLLYIHPHLSKKPFLDRLKYGIKYIFGYQSKYGAWDEFLLNPDDVPKLQDMINYLKKNKNEETVLRRYQEPNY